MEEYDPASPTEGMDNDSGDKVDGLKETETVKLPNIMDIPITDRWVPCEKSVIDDPGYKKTKKKRKKKKKSNLNGNSIMFDDDNPDMDYPPMPVQNRPRFPQIPSLMDSPVDPRDTNLFRFRGPSQPFEPQHNQPMPLRPQNFSWPPPPHHQNNFPQRPPPFPVHHGPPIIPDQQMHNPPVFEPGMPNQPPMMHPDQGMMQNMVPPPGPMPPMQPPMHTQPPPMHTQPPPMQAQQPPVHSQPPSMQPQQLMQAPIPFPPQPLPPVPMSLDQIQLPPAPRLDVPLPGSVPLPPEAEPSVLKKKKSKFKKGGREGSGDKPIEIVDSPPHVVVIDDLEEGDPKNEQGENIEEKKEEVEEKPSAARKLLNKVIKATKLGEKPLRDLNQLPPMIGKGLLSLKNKPKISFQVKGNTKTVDPTGAKSLEETDEQEEESQQQPKLDLSLRPKITKKTDIFKPDDDTTDPMVQQLLRARNDMVIQDKTQKEEFQSILATLNMQNKGKETEVVTEPNKIRNEEKSGNDIDKKEPQSDKNTVSTKAKETDETENPSEEKNGDQNSENTQKSTETSAKDERISREKSPERSRHDSSEISPEKSRESRERSSSKTKRKQRDRSKERSRHRSRDKSRSRDRSKERRRHRSREGSRDRSRDRSRSRERHRHRSRDKSRGRSGHSRSRDKSADRSKERSRERSRNRSESKSRTKSKKDSKDRSRENSRDSSRERSKDRHSRSVSKDRHKKSKHSKEKKSRKRRSRSWNESRRGYPGKYYEDDRGYYWSGSDTPWYDFRINYTGFRHHPGYFMADPKKFAHLDKRIDDRTKRRKYSRSRSRSHSRSRSRSHHKSSKRKTKSRHESKSLSPKPKQEKKHDKTDSESNDSEDSSSSSSSSSASEKEAPPKKERKKKKKKKTKTKKSKPGTESENSSSDSEEEIPQVKKKTKKPTEAPVKEKTPSSKKPEHKKKESSDESSDSSSSQESDSSTDEESPKKMAVKRKHDSNLNKDKNPDKNETKTSKRYDTSSDESPKAKKKKKKPHDGKNKLEEEFKKMETSTSDDSSDDGYKHKKSKKSKSSHKHESKGKNGKSEKSSKHSSKKKSKGNMDASEKNSDMSESNEEKDPPGKSEQMQSKESSKKKLRENMDTSEKISNKSESDEEKNQSGACKEINNATSDVSSKPSEDEELVDPLIQMKLRPVLTDEFEPSEESEVCDKNMSAKVPQQKDREKTSQKVPEVDMFASDGETEINREEIKVETSNTKSSKSETSNTKTNKKEDSSNSEQTADKKQGKPSKVTDKLENQSANEYENRFGNEGFSEKKKSSPMDKKKGIIETSKHDDKRQEDVKKSHQTITDIEEYDNKDSKSKVNIGDLKSKDVIEERKMEADSQASDKQKVKEETKHRKNLNNIKDFSDQNDQEASKSREEFGDMKSRDKDLIEEKNTAADSHVSDKPKVKEETKHRKSRDREHEYKKLEEDNDNALNKRRRSSSESSRQKDFEARNSKDDEYYDGQRNRKHWDEEYQSREATRDIYYGDGENDHYEDKYRTEYHRSRGSDTRKEREDEYYSYSEEDYRRQRRNNYSRSRRHSDSEETDTRYEHRRNRDSDYKRQRDYEYTRSRDSERSRYSEYSSRHREYEMSPSRQYESKLKTEDHKEKEYERNYEYSRSRQEVSFEHGQSRSRTSDHSRSGERRSEKQSDTKPRQSSGDYSDSKSSEKVKTDKMEGTVSAGDSVINYYRGSNIPVQAPVQSEKVFKPDNLTELSRSCTDTARPESKLSEKSKEIKKESETPQELLKYIKKDTKQLDDPLSQFIGKERKLVFSDTKTSLVDTLLSPKTMKNFLDPSKSQASSVFSDSYSSTYSGPLVKVEPSRKPRRKFTDSPQPFDKQVHGSQLALSNDDISSGSELDIQKSSTHDKLNPYDKVTSSDSEALDHMYGTKIPQWQATTEEAYQMSQLLHPGYPNAAHASAGIPVSCPSMSYPINVPLPQQSSSTTYPLSIPLPAPHYPTSILTPDMIPVPPPVPVNIPNTQEKVMNVQTETKETTQPKVLREESAFDTDNSAIGAELRLNKPLPNQNESDKPPARNLRSSRFSKVQESKGSDETPCDFPIFDQPKKVEPIDIFTSKTSSKETAPGDLANSPQTISEQASSNVMVIQAADSSYSPTKPLKVKSRWLKFSEAEPAEDSDDATGSKVNQSMSNLVSIVPVENVASSTEGDLTTLPTPSESNLDETSSVSQKDQLDSESAKEEAEKPDPVPHFEPLDESLYLIERRQSKEMKRMVCDCSITDEDREMGIEACGGDCLNRMLYIECGSRCACAEYCTNKRFQNRSYSNVEVFQTSWKGFGLRAVEDLSPDVFVMEYVGEVLDYRGFKNRSRQYAKENQKHFYFMALTPDIMIDATLKGNISRFINHSCDPNCETQKWTVNGELRIGFFTRKNISAGEELTFNYQFETFGQNAQKCFCGAQNCRGVIGIEKPLPSKNKKKDKVKKKMEDLVGVDEIEEQIEAMNVDGLLNKQQVLNLCRLMVYVQETDQRIAILKILQNTPEPACLRLFIDYHGLPLLWSWMADNPDSKEFQIQVVNLLSELPITNRTILQDSKILSIIEKWSETAEAECLTEPAPPPPPAPAVPTSSSASLTTSSSSPSVSGPVLPPLPISTTTPVGILSDPKDTKESREKTSKKRVTFAEEDEINNIERSDTESMCEASSSSMYSDLPEGAALMSGMDLDIDEDQDNCSAVVSSEADSSNSDKPSEDKKDGIVGSSGSDFDSQDEDSSSDSQDKPASISLSNIAGKLLEQWSSLKEVFKIPRKERVEERKRTERELDTRYKGHVDEPFADWTSKRKRKARKHDDALDRNKKSSHPTPPRMSKEKRRKLFEEQVKAQDEVNAELQRQQLEALKAAFPLVPVDCFHCPGFIENIQNNPNFVMQLHDPNFTMQLQDPNFILQFADPNLLPENANLGIPHPDAEMGLQLQDPNGIIQDPNGMIQDPNLLMQLIQDPNYIQAQQLLQQQQQQQQQQQNYALQLQQSGNYALQLQPDPNTLPPMPPHAVMQQQGTLQHPGTIQQGAFIDVNGQIIQPGLVTKQDLNIPLQTQYVIDPATAQPILCQQQQHQQLHQQQQLQQLLGLQVSLPISNPANNSTDEDVPPPPSPPRPKPAKLPPNWKTAKDSEGKTYYYHSITRITQWDPPGWDENEVPDMEIGTPTFDEKSKKNRKTTTAAADTSSEVEKKFKDHFRKQMSSYIVTCLNPYRKAECKMGKITSTDDFKHLARKLTHHVMAKELKHCRHVEDLEVNENVKSKAKDYVRKYMSKSGAVYKKPLDDDIY